MEERLQKYLAKCGIASRREAENLIKEGYISVNGVIVRDMGIKVDQDKDSVVFNGKTVKPENNKIYIMLNKPVGYITTMKEQFNRSKVTDLLMGVNERVYPIGRLDYNSSGLLLLTNDGNLTFKLTHPGHEVNKTYSVEVKGLPDECKLDKLRNGVNIDGYMTAPALVKIIKLTLNSSILEITIHEGRNRQIRKMCSAIGHEVISLKRISIGRLTLGNLAEGNWRALNKGEIEYLKSL